MEVLLLPKWEAPVTSHGGNAGDSMVTPLWASAKFGAIPHGIQYLHESTGRSVRVKVSSEC